MTIDLQWCAAHLRSCNGRRWIYQGRQIHQILLKTGQASSTFSGNCLLQMYTRCGPDLSDACRLFGEMPHKNCFSWNSVLDACLNSGDSAASLRLFSLMPHKNEYSWNAIITGLVRLGNTGEARKIFDKMPVKNAITLNSIIHGYFGSGNAHEALDVCKRLNSVLMGTWILCLDKFVLATLISFCADQRYLRLGKQIHSLIVVSQMEKDAVLISSIVDMYGKCGDLHTACKYLEVTAEPDEFSLSALITAFVSSGRFVEARRLFASREDPGVVLWNSIINGYASNGEGEEALGLFIQMRRRGVDPDKSTFASVLSVCASTGVLVNAKQVHAVVLKLGILEDIIVASALMDSYSKAGNWDDACSVFRKMKVHDTILLNSLINVYSGSGRITEARKVFDNIPGKTIISWNSMIVGYSQNGLSVEAVELFIEMHRRDIGIDKVTLASIISASASLCSLSIGEQVYALVIIHGLESDQIIATSLVDLYCKCGFIAEGRRVFDVMVKVDEAPWNSMLMGYASNGLGIQVLKLFEAMRKDGVTPNEVTFIAILSACCHCGLVEDGLRCFKNMKKEFNVQPTIEHYSCAVDLLVRAGRVEEAVDFIDGMPFKADASMWTSVLGGCKACDNELLGNKVAERLIELNPSCSGPYVQISSIYAANGEWSRSQCVRSLMQERRLKKIPGFSWIDSNFLQ